jgi:hypothetical protein
LISCIRKLAFVYTEHKPRVGSGREPASTEVIDG